MSEYEFEQYIDETELIPNSDSVVENLPKWVKLHKYGQSIYEAIQLLEKEKLQYIKKNRKKEAFAGGNKKKFTIKATEIAKLIGKKSQNLFYPKEDTANKLLLGYVESINKNKLIKAKDNKLSNANTGNAGKNKEQLLNELTAKQKDSKKLTEETIDQLFDRTLQSIPLDILAKLEINRS